MSTIGPDTTMFIRDCLDENVNFNILASRELFNTRWGSTSTSSSYCLNKSVEMMLKANIGNDVPQTSQNSDTINEQETFFKTVEPKLTIFLTKLLIFLEKNESTENKNTINSLSNPLEEVKNFCGKEKSKATAGVCQNSLISICSRFSNAELSYKNNILNDFCACHTKRLDIPQSVTASKINKDTLSILDSTECYDTCVNTSSVKLTNKTPLTKPPYTMKTCSKSVCIMSNINVSSDNTKNINFSQNCSSCKDNCVCIFKDNTIEDLKKNVKTILDNSKKSCNENSLYITSEGLVDESSIGIDILDPQNLREEDEKNNIMRNILLIGGGFLTFVVLLTLLYYLIKKIKKN